MRYLDPKADLTFKKVFAKHPDLLISLLNALLPLSDDEQIESVEYLPNELVPELYEHKNSIVDVLCQDIRGRKFCVEMQMEWTSSFQQRVLFNASKLYVTQAQRAERYSDLKPVYSLNIVNDYIDKDIPLCIHNYSIVHDQYSHRVIEGLRFTFVELPKFTPHTFLEKHMTVLWLRFLTEISSQTKEVPSELTENPEISKALKEVEISAFTEEELRAYDKFWDSVRTEKSMIYDSVQKGFEKGRAEGKAEGRAEEKVDVAKRLLIMGIDAEQVAKGTGLPIEEVQHLKEEL